MASSDYWGWTGVKGGTFGRGAPRGNPSTRTQLFAADRRTSHGSKKKKLWKRLRKQKKATAAQQADGGPGARGAHSGESCTGTDVNTRGSSHTKRPLVGHFRMPRARWSILRNPQVPNGSAWGNRKKHHITVRDLLRFLTSWWRFL